MSIQAINTSMGLVGCQPIKQVGFARKKPVPTEEPKPAPSGDIFTPSDPHTTEQKYDLACRLAAYYKTQYEKLAEKTPCYA